MVKFRMITTAHCDWTATIAGILQQIRPGVDFELVALDDLGHGHYTTRYALRMQNPLEYAQQLAADFNQLSDTKASVAGAGYVNFRLSNNQLIGGLRSLLNAGEDYGKPNATGVISVDHTDVNPTGLAHVGHGRMAAAGDTLCRFLRWCGYTVHREYIMNDCGNQIDLLIRSVEARLGELEGKPLQIPADGYRSTYLREIAQEIKQRGVSDLRSFVLEYISADIMRDLRSMNVEFDHVTSEHAMQKSGAVERAVNLIAQHTYLGKLPKPKSHTGSWTPQELLLLRMQDTPSDDDVVLQKSNRQWTYFGSDIAFHRLRIERGADRLINVFGADHHAHGPKLARAVQLLTEDRVPLDFLWVQMVSIKKNGTQLRMSKRAGDYVTLRELIEQLGSDVVRVAMLMRSLNSPLEVDIDLLRRMSKDNPYYYMQYAYARTHSAQRINPTSISGADLGLLTEPAELDHISVLLRWPEQVLRIAQSPPNIHHLVSYARAVSGSFHAWWNAGIEHQSKRFSIPTDPKLSAARMSLVYATQQTLEIIMGILGITPISQLDRLEE